MNSTYVIRPAVESDVLGLESLDKHSNPHPWGRTLVADALEVRLNWVMCEAQNPNTIVAWLTASRCVDQSELELVLVDSNVRRQGIAKQLVQHWLDSLNKQGVAEFLLEVRESNLAAIYLYEALGFELVGRRKQYYQTETGRESACLYTLVSPVGRG
ncbi:GNAT family N-acetyltransferase [Marinomonas posidonica]|uniref:GCN5-related N-acetyltransferase n=1 Tax=Marinomonas posidonica (strain CECT 7376 / NCIMB 14433 / IVIA-Po-181) TaxID=491952 RepID=F6CXP9_MARPP|nr:GNAT family N-acetyltransferase [Marinomonas posidonica]AEF53362.1 GCN5-related N-acetyltransferase [Marinomonas posidonica IVIA-Po-181]